MLNPDFENNELIPAIVQSAHSGRVLMLGYMNREAFELTKSSGLCHFWSRSRQEIWKKGATSGNYLKVTAMELDCDSDAILVVAIPAGPSCHTGDESCFDSHRMDTADDGVSND
jgi:phosphoribosyl-AMP cyclohydrolase